MRGRPIVYSHAELSWLERNQVLPIGEYYVGFCEWFDRNDLTAANLHALRKRMGWRTGRTGRFVAGAAPANKGRRMPFNAKCAATQFKKGARTGKAALLYKPIGTERLTRDGYLERKIHDGLPMQSRWRAVHLIRWEEVNGPVPHGFALKSLDGDRANTDPSNWEAIPRGVLARLNGGRCRTRLAYDDAHPEVKPAVMAIAKIQHQAAERRKGSKA